MGICRVKLLVEEVDAPGVRHVQPAEELGALGVGGRGETIHLEGAELLEDLGHGLHNKVF